MPTRLPAHPSLLTLSAGASRSHGQRDFVKAVDDLLQETSSAALCMRPSNESVDLITRQIEAELMRGMVNQGFARIRIPVALTEALQQALPVNRTGDFNHIADTFEQARAAFDSFLRFATELGEIARTSSQADGIANDTSENAAFLKRAASIPDSELDEAPVGDAVPAAMTAELLGGAKVLGMSVHDAIDLARAVQSGLPAAVLDQLRTAGFTGPEVEELVAPARTLARRRKEGRLTVEESSAVERTARTLVTADRVLGSRQSALGWLRRPLATRFAGSPPIQFLRTDIGARVVEEMLMQAEYGLTA